VIKVERAGEGDFARHYDSRVAGLSSHFVWANRSKESLALDLKSPLGGEVMSRLLARADVFVQNLAPGAAARLGLGAAALHARHPRMVVCDISGYGNDGPYRDRKAYDLLIQAEAGFLSVTGSPAEPAKAGSSIADIAAGMYAYSSILSALLLRGRTGEGSHIDVSMLESLAEWMGYPLYYAHEGAEPPPRMGAAHATIYPYGPFVAGDGRTVMLGLQNEREWQAFCESVLEDAGLAADQRFASNAQRNANREALRAIIVARFSKLTSVQVRERLDRAQIANAAVNTMADVWRHPQLAARGRWTQVGSPAGPLPALKPPGANDRFEYRMDPIPAIGEHNEAILRELGFAAAEIDAARAMVKSPLGSAASHGS
jgi:itaconate CoA-transferase